MMNSQATTVIGAKPLIELNNGTSTLVFQLTEAQHRLGRDQSWADLAPDQEDQWQVLSREHARLIQGREGYRILDGNGEKSSSNGLFFNHQRIDGKTGYLLQHGTVIEIGQNPANQIRLTYYDPNDDRPITPTTYRSLDLSQLQSSEKVILGRSTGQGYYSFSLESPTISREHAYITRIHASDRYQIQDNSANGTFINGQRIWKPVELTDGAIINIGPFKVLFRGSKLELCDSGSSIRLDAHHVVRKVMVKGQPRQILNHVSLPIEPGQLVALVGGSGAGKSTLMKSLLGIEPLEPVTGVSHAGVYLNGVDLRQNFQLYRTQIGYVPQDDIVHYNLRVEEVLRFACKLRLPPDADGEQVIHETLNRVQLTHVKETFVRDLSGGQRKRVSIAVELLADPKLFFLDEPTSGLDPGLDKQMMLLLRKLANEGRTIVLVTHATNNIKECDRLAFMGRGGYLCYYGPPEETVQFFEMGANSDFSDIYIKLDQEQQENGVVVPVDKIVQNWSQRFHQSAQHEQYVKQKLGNCNEGQAATPASPPPAPVQTSPVQQWLYLAQRYATLMCRDRFSLSLSLLTAPLTLIILTIALGDDAPFAPLEELVVSQAPLALRVLFIFTCLAIWVGLSSAVQAIVKEISIYRRERLVNMGILPYLGSKLVTHGAIVVLQTLLITVTALLAFEPPAAGLISWPIGLAFTTFLTLMTNISLALMISSWVENEDQANSILPPIMLMQIILSGVLFKLEGLGNILSGFTMSRWATNAYAAIVNLNAMVPEPVILPDGTEMEAIFETSPMYEATWGNLGLCWLMLGLHLGGYLGLTVWGLKRRDIV
ncbi:MAG: ATP-binding cassette domain-containing protein [Prochlorothrix sp.]